MPPDPVQETASRPRGARCGRGCVIVMACFGIYLMMIGFIKCFGILFVEFVNEFNSSVSVASVIMGLTAATTSITSLLVSIALTRRFSLRSIAMTGAVAASTGVVLSSLAPSIYFLLFSLSFCVGCGQGLIYCPGMILIGQYFDRGRGLATAIATCGPSAGAIMLPLLLRFLLDVYALRGALLIVGGVMMNMFALSTLYKPLSIGEIKNNSREEIIEDGDAADSAIYSFEEDTSLMKPVLEKNRNNSINNPCTSLPSIVVWEGDMSLSQSEYTMRHVKSEHCILGRDQTSLERNLYVSHADSICLSTINLGALTRDDDTCSSGNASDSGYRKLTTNPIFWMMFGFNFFGVVASCLVPTFLPPMVTEKGLTDVQAVLLVSLFSAVDLVSRLTSGVIADIPGVNRRYILLGSFLVVGVILQCTNLYSSLERIIAFVVVFGLFSGTYGALHPVLIIDILGSETFARAFGFVQVFHGASVACFFPFLGCLRDLTGSYTTSLCVLGGSQLLAALFVVLMPILQRKSYCRNMWTGGNTLW